MSTIEYLSYSTITINRNGIVNIWRPNFITYDDMKKPRRCHHLSNSDNSDNSRSNRSTRRTRLNFFELARNNDWSHFCTITIDPDKHDRYDIEGTTKYLLKFFNHYRNRFNPNFQYLIIPELHHDGAIHYHGFINGIIDLIPAVLPSGDIKKHNGQIIYNSKYFQGKLGFVEFMPLYGDIDNAAKYCSKYITKSLSDICDIIGSSSKLIYHSAGLNRAAVHHLQIDLSKLSDFLSFKNDYGSCYDMHISDLVPLLTDEQLNLIVPFNGQ